VCTTNAGFAVVWPHPFQCPCPWRGARHGHGARHGRVWPSEREC
jgi:hypothetical protein